MKKILLMAMFITIAFSQYTDGNTVVTISKYKWEPLAGSELTWSDRTADVTEFHTKRNEAARKLMSSMFLTHFWTGEVSEVFILGEFKNMGDATDYAGFNNINSIAWFNQEERAAAVSNYNRHFQSYHEDVHILEHWGALEKKNTMEVTGEENIVGGSVVSIGIRYWKPMSDVEGGSSEERLEMMKKYADEVVKKILKLSVKKC